MKWFNLQMTKAILIGLLCALGFAFIALLINGEFNIGFDAAVIGVVQGWESPGLTTILTWLTAIGAGWPVAGITVLSALFLYFVLHHRREVILLLSAGAASGLLNVVLKQIFRRTRPDIYRLIDIHGYSFPSGHSMAAFTLYGMLSYLLWRHANTVALRVAIVLFSVVMIVGIGVSRIYLGVHYPSDVLGGYLASGSLLAVMIHYYEKAQGKGARAASAGKK
ncbi:hypothetical protein SY83_04140 [Paenibacillus swuensis]|uniref:Phosphatidic acid phosphatase type 2/haloperoxidase domain-containing protein n=1 Tax=Paenibacillus swuensis TaxID=1178515 RepID=A0A172TFR1_9BACL|nr:phosphatase PAP2 family protein [Paenibacillus swuensis]ANE45623.1 hypothetical protein SY83_04140 [Paenibacillus swuensis]